MTGVPYIPRYITVHLGRPDAYAQNVTVTFPDYIKTVASSEIYPTWPSNSLRANIYVQVTFALNRVYTEWYRRRGYEFDITTSTQFDQKYIHGRDIFQSVSTIVDELFNDYIRRQGFIEPVFAQFCNGTTVTCEGLSQWGSQRLAQQGYNTVQILRSYYGEVEIVANAPIQNYAASSPEIPLRRGSIGPNVVVIQTELNRISQNYPAIPKVPVVDGILGEQTEASLIAFQRIFNLDPDGIVGPATWYALVRLYTAVTSLSELRSQGQRFYTIASTSSRPIQEGDRGIRVEHLQYMLRVIGAYISAIPQIEVDGIFGPATRDAVLAAQRYFGLPQTGSVDLTTWDEIYDQFVGIENASFRDLESVPYTSAIIGGTAPRNRYSRTTTMTQFPGYDLAITNQDPIRQEVTR